MKTQRTHPKRHSMTSPSLEQNFGALATCIRSENQISLSPAPIIVGRAKALMRTDLERIE